MFILNFGCLIQTRTHVPPLSNTNRDIGRTLHILGIGNNVSCLFTVVETKPEEPSLVLPAAVAATDILNSTRTCVMAGRPRRI